MLSLEYLHQFGWLVFHLKTQLTIFEDLEETLVSQCAGAHAVSSPFEMSWTVLDLPGRHSPSTWYCSHCNPSLLVPLRPTEPDDACLTCFTNAFVSPLGPVASSSGSVPCSNSHASNASQSSDIVAVQGKKDVPQKQLHWLHESFGAASEIEHSHALQ